MARSKRQSKRPSSTEQQQRLPDASPLVRGLLIDIDGVLHLDSQLIRGAVDAIEYLALNHFPFLLATNTTRRSRFALLNNLKQMGFKITLEQIYSAPFAAAQWLKEHQAQSIYLMTLGDTYREFKDFRITTAKPQYLIIGDLGEDLTYDRLNQAFRLVMDGAKMVALQKNRYWRRGDGLAIDTGAIVAALEYATRKKAVVIGKPSAAFYEEAVKLLQLPKESIAMIGDDWESDIQGSLKVGLQAIAVKTGKLLKGFPPKVGKSDAVTMDSIASLPEWLKTQGA